MKVTTLYICPVPGSQSMPLNRRRIELNTIPFPPHVCYYSRFSFPLPLFFLRVCWVFGEGNQRGIFARETSEFVEDLESMEGPLQFISEGSLKDICC